MKLVIPARQGCSYRGLQQVLLEFPGGLLGRGKNPLPPKKAPLINRVKVGVRNVQREVQLELPGGGRISDEICSRQIQLV
jgi:hypothetical protein